MKILTMKYLRLAAAVFVVLVFPVADRSQDTVCPGTCGRNSADCSPTCYERCHKGMCGMVVCMPGHHQR
jgi:hypothetical protein